MMVLPEGILMPKLVSVKEQPMPKITSASPRNFGTARGIATPPEPSDSGCVSGKDDLPPRLVQTGIASFSASRLSCGQGVHYAKAWPQLKRLAEKLELRPGFGVMHALAGID